MRQRESIHPMSFRECEFLDEDTQTYYQVDGYGQVWYKPAQDIQWCSTYIGRANGLTRMTVDNMPGRLYQQYYIALRELYTRQYTQQHPSEVF
jgi:hypothetical protein